MSEKKQFIHVDDSDAVGYGKPPKHTRFKPGQSGNPRGRRRTVDYAGWENPIQKYLLEPVTVTIKGKKEKVPAVDALMKMAIGRALGGCTKHLKVLLDGSGGLKALIQEQGRQTTLAQEAIIEQARRELHKWMPDGKCADEPSSPQKLS
jgi:Family of unknown function (DUF5681)